MIDSDGWLAGVRRVESPNCDERPAGTAVSLLVVHAISLPPGEYGGDAIEKLFTNRLDPAAHPYFQEIAGLKVSAHFLVRRDGRLVQFVPVQRRAWHAGASSWRGRHACNDFSACAARCRCATSPPTATSRRDARPIPAPRSPGRACCPGSPSPVPLYVVRVPLYVVRGRHPVPLSCAAVPQSA